MSFLTLDLNLLRVFDAVMTEQNLTRAAGHLAMTQPAVSNAIKRLRDRIGDELLIRTAYGVKPTPRAEALWPAVRRALTELEAAVTPESFNVADAHATFRMAMADATAALWLPALVRALETDAPGLNCYCAVTLIWRSVFSPVWQPNYRAKPVLPSGTSACTPANTCV
jgi:DNA-binding transcriptional LysR family regulator